MKVIKGSFDISGIKRCYFPGMKIKIDCPNCGKIMKREFDNEYISYPELGKNEIGFVCDMEGGCEKDFLLEIRISTEVTFSYDDTKLKEC